MGLAPYGRPQHVNAIFDHLLDLKPDGTFRLNMEYFDYCTGLTMTSGKFHSLFGAPPRKPETLLTQREMDLARSIQDVTEEVMLRLARTLHRETGTEHLCPRRWRRPQLCGQWQGPERGSLPEPLDPARRG
jgi:carbamoyltransferase